MISLNKLLYPFKGILPAPPIILRITIHHHERNHNGFPHNTSMLAIILCWHARVHYNITHYKQSHPIPIPISFGKFVLENTTKMLEPRVRATKDQSLFMTVDQYDLCITFFIASNLFELRVWCLFGISYSVCFSVEVSFGYQSSSFFRTSHAFAHVFLFFFFQSIHKFV